MSDKTPIEVEVKIPIKDFDELFHLLQDEGFDHTTVLEEVDTYFNSIYYDLKERDKALRIRRTIDKTTGKEWSELNCKGPKLDDVSVSRSEREISIENPAEMEAILAEIGFLPVQCIVKKTRYCFSRDRITVMIDRVEGLGDFLELEILEVGESKRSECLDEIEGVMDKLGYSMKDTVRNSYLSMLVKEKSVND